MAGRARLSAPREEQTGWAWHEAKFASLPSSIFWSGDRRMEGGTYLSSGYGVRLAMEARTIGRTNLGTMARVWQPSRLKGIVVSRDYGTPFLAATQVFDLRPAARKYLSLDRTDSVTQRMASPGMILVTRSGSVGRATLAHRPHENTLISDDLLRVTPKDERQWGWIYAYLRSPQARAMMTAVQYGHMIKHLEIAHLNALPIPMLRDDLLTDFQTRTRRVLDLRIESFEKAQQAELQFEQCFPSYKRKRLPATGFSVKTKEIFGTRRRLDASRYVPNVDAVIAAFKRDALRLEPLSELSKVFVPGRFKHIYGDGGMPYLDSADILEVNPDITKYVLSLSEKEQLDYHVKPGWMLIPCSGQVYGNIGHTVLATEWHVGKVLTNHILRVCPNKRIRSGYLQCVLGHLELGRPQIIRFAFGSSVPEIAAGDVSTLAIPRLDDSIEKELADLMEASAVARGLADEMEEALANDAEKLIDSFLAGESTAFPIR